MKACHSQTGLVLTLDERFDTKIITAQPDTMVVIKKGLKIVSVGYEGRTIENFVEMLRLNEVDMVVDVRLNPISRKKGFSKTALSQALAETGIEYRHERDLGNPKQNRDPFRQGLQSARKRYIEHIQNGASGAYKDVIDLAHETQIALLCYEREHQQCHRSCILELAEHEHPGLSILKL